MAFELISDILLPRLLAASVQSTILVTVVWALCRFVPRLSAATRCWLWWLVALQLLVGLAWSSPMALPLLPAETVQPALQVAQVAPVIDAGETSIVFAPTHAPATSFTWSWTAALAVAWLLGLSVMVTRSLRGCLATRHLLRTSEPCRDRSLLHALALAADAHGLRAPPRLRLSDAIDSPQLIGPWRPVLLLPVHHAESMQPDELDMALTHELVHLQRRDLWLGLVPALAQHVFFFHPLAHLAAREYGLSREAACDAAVLEGNRHCAREYGQLLLRLGVAPRPCAGLASASPDFTLLKRRLTMLQTTSSCPRIVAVLMTVAIGVVGVMPYRLTAATPAATPQATATATASAAAPALRDSRTSTTTATRNAVAVDPADMPAPPAPVAPPRPAAPPAPPAPVEPASGALGGTFTIHGKAEEHGFALLDGDHSITVSSTSDLREAQAARRGDAPVLWFRRGDARYVIRDRATIDAIRDAYTEVTALGAAQGELGARQGALGGQQGVLGARQAEIGVQAARRALANVDVQAQVDANVTAALQTRQVAMQEETRDEMQRLAREQVALAREQTALASRQQTATTRAERNARALMEAAIRNGLSERL